MHTRSLFWRKARHLFGDDCSCRCSATTEYLLLYANWTPNCGEYRSLNWLFNRWECLTPVCCTACTLIHYKNTESWVFKDVWSIKLLAHGVRLTILLLHLYSKATAQKLQQCLLKANISIKMFDSRSLKRVICMFLFPQDPRFNAEVDHITGYKTQSILCLPIKNHRDEVRCHDQYDLLCFFKPLPLHR